MLHQVLRELESAGGPMNLNELGRKLGVERSALAGMIDYWVRKGRLQDNDLVMDAAVCNSSACSAGVSCPGPQGCPFVMKMPRTFSLVTLEK